MITTVTYRPNFLSPAYNPIVWTCASDNVSLPYFKYIVDLYVDGVKTTRIKQRPNPLGYCMVDFSTVMQGLMDFNLSTAPVACGETSIDWIDGKVFQDNSGLSHQIYIKVGEEYQTTPPSGAIEIHTGSAGDAVGEPAFAIYSGLSKSYQTNVPVQVWPASVPNYKQMLHMQQYDNAGVFGVYNPDQIQYVYETDYPYPLSFDTASRYVTPYDKVILSYLTRDLVHTSFDTSFIYGFRYVFKLADGTTTVTKDVPLIAANGFGMRTICSNTISIAPIGKYDIVHVDASPSDLRIALQIDDEDWPDYGGSITVTGYAEGASCTFGLPVTEPIVLTFRELQTCGLYGSVRLSWMNTLGGRDYMNFDMLTEKTINTTQDNYYQEQLNYSGSSPVESVNYMIGEPVAIQSNQKFTKGGSKAYNKNMSTSYRIQTDWLTQDQVNLLEGLVSSSQVLAYIREGEDATQHWFYPHNVSVVQTNYVTKNVKQTKLIQAEFTITLTEVQKIATT